MSLVNAHTANFNGRDLASIEGLTILQIKMSPAKRNLTMADIARSNQSKALSGFYDKKTLPIRIAITRNSRDLAEQSFDDLMAILQGREGDLLVRQSGVLRRYSATYADFVQDISGGSYIEGDLIFETSDHFGYSLDKTLLINASGRTLYNYTDNFTIDGSAPTQAPIIKITFSALTGGTTKDVTIGNPASGQFITVNRTWLAGDALVIDSQNQTITVNDIDVDYSGSWPEWEKGPGYLQTTDGFLTRTMRNYTDYYKRYV